MSHAEKCPICQGAGTIVKFEYPPATCVTVPTICHGCNGKGWITVEDEMPDYNIPLQIRRDSPEVW